MTVFPDVALHQRGLGTGGKQKGLLDLARGVYINVGHSTKFAKFQRTYRDDRVAFVYDCMPKIAPTFAPYQEEALAWFDMGHRRVAMRGPHGLGKTLIAAICVHHVILTTEDDATAPTLASVWRQLEKFLWPEIHKVAKLLDWNTIGRDPYTHDEMMVHSLRIRSGMGWNESFAVSSGDAASIEGAHASRLFYIFDESKSVGPSMWDAAEGAFATEGTSTIGGGSGECFWLAISTPGPPQGRFYDIHSKKAGYDDWIVRHVTLDEAIAANRISPQWAEERQSQWGVHSAVYKNRVLGEFAQDSSEGVIPLEWVEAAFERYRQWEKAGSPGAGLSKRVIGVDSARMGEDKTVFADRVGDRLENLYVYAKQSVPVSAGKLKPFAMHAHLTNIEMDSGLGASIYDILAQEIDWANPSMNLAQIYMGGGTTRTDKTGTFRFRCVRDAAWWNMREMLDPDSGADVALCPNDYLLGDLAAPRYETRYIHGYLTICVESKDILRKKTRHGRSTDYGDACVLAFWEETSGGSGVVF